MRLSLRTKEANMKMDLVKADAGELREALEELDKEQLIKLIMGLKRELGEEFESFTFEFEDIPFERIRRITGYLVGTLERFNDAKRAEEHDRVKHGVTEDCGSDGCGCTAGR